MPQRHSRGQQQRQLDLVQTLNRERLVQDKVNSQREGIIESRELAFRMPSAAPKLMDTSDESQQTLDAYGIGGGQTDEHGIKAEVDKMHIHDLNATILHLLGVDHTRLPFRYSGYDFRLTDVHGNVAHTILA